MENRKKRNTTFRRIIKLKHVETETSAKAADPARFSLTIAAIRQCSKIAWSRSWSRSAAKSNGLFNCCQWDIHPLKNPWELDNFLSFISKQIHLVGKRSRLKIYQNTTKSYFCWRFGLYQRSWYRVPVSFFLM